MGRISSYPEGYKPARSSGIHCDRCDIVFAAPAPAPDAQGRRICRDCRQEAALYDPPSLFIVEGNQ